MTSVNRRDVAAIACLSVFTVASECGVHEGAVDEVGCQPLQEALTVRASGVWTPEGDLQVTGSLTPTPSTAIRNLTVAGERAQLTSFNFETFSVRIPRASVPALGGSEPGAACATVDPRAVCLTVEVEPACGAPPELDAVSVTVARLSIEFMRNADAVSSSRLTLPANGDVESGLTVVLTGSFPVEAKLTLMTAPGAVGEARFDRRGGPTELELTVDDSSEAGTFTASTLLVGITAGATVLIVEAAPDLPREFQLVVAGPPEFTPTMATAGAGVALPFTIESDIGLGGCTVEGSDATVSIAGRQPVGGEIPLDGLRFVRGSVEFSEAEMDAGTEGGVASVTCTDLLDQSSTATFMREP